MRYTTLLHVVLAAAFVVCIKAQTCYYPDGSISEDTPCKSTTNSNGHSACCGKDSVCLSSGLCLDFGVVSRGACTDKNYSDVACAKYCRDVSTWGGVPIVPRAWGTTVADFRWCCDFPNANGECKSNSTITVQAGRVLAGDILLDTANPSRNPAFATTTPSNAIPGPSIPTNSCNTYGMNNTTETCIASSKVATVATGVGVGVGAPLGIAVAVLLFMFLKEKRRHKRGEILTGEPTYETTKQEPQEISTAPGSLQPLKTQKKPMELNGRASRTELP